jgi:hypothetical protein
LIKCCGDKLVLGCFFSLGSAASVGCVWKSLETSGKVWEGEKGDDSRQREVNKKIICWRFALIILFIIALIGP